MSDDRYRRVMQKYRAREARKKYSKLHYLIVNINGWIFYYPLAHPEQQQRQGTNK